MIKVVYRYNADIWKNPYTVKNFCARNDKVIGKK